MEKKNAKKKKKNVMDAVKLSQKENQVNQKSKSAQNVIKIYQRKNMDMDWDVVK